MNLTIYIAASFKHLHGARLLGRELRKLGYKLLDWTEKASPPPGLTPAQRRIWMDTDQEGGQVYKFCRDACAKADIVVYYGESGQDAGVEVGIASASGAAIIGIRGPLEGAGLMLHGAVDVWTEEAESALALLEKLARYGAMAFAVPENEDPRILALAARIRDRNQSDRASD